MSRGSGHFCFAALPSLLEQGGKTKMQVSKANGHSLTLQGPLKGIAEGNPSLSAFAHRSFSVGEPQGAKIYEP